MIWPSSEVLAAFGAAGAVVAPIEGGHVHRTFAAHAASGGVLLQAVNPAVNGDAWALAMRTVAVAEALVAHPDPMLTDRRALRTRGGAVAVVDDDERVWRAFELIERAVAADEAADPPAPAIVAHLFGRFARRAAAAGITPMATGPFHDLRRRLDDLAAARLAPTVSAPDHLLADLDRAISAVPLPGPLPTRPVHNDAKPANLLVDETSGVPVAVIDLDLVGHGSIVDDLGDLLRSQVFDGDRLDLEQYEAVVDGYLHGLEPLLSYPESRAIALAGDLITLELAVRRVTDHLSAGGYFADAGSGENLAQAALQLRRVDALLAERSSIGAITERTAAPFLAPSTGG